MVPPTKATVPGHATPRLNGTKAVCAVHSWKRSPISLRLLAVLPDRSDEREEEDGAVEHQRLGVADDQQDARSPRARSPTSSDGG